MCGRYVIDANQDDIAARFNAEVSDLGFWNWDPNYNITPTTIVPAIAFDAQKQRKLVPMRWGLHPHWRQDPPSGKPLFNARSETASQKASFRTPMRRRRALIPATHWYEWTSEQGGKIPWCIKPDSLDPGSENLFAFAGLWDMWRVEEGITLLSCTILTTQSDGALRDLHHRIPIRLPEPLWDRWLDPQEQADRCLGKALPSDDLIFWEVAQTVNSNRSKGADLIAPSA